MLRITGLEPMCCKLVDAERASEEAAAVVRRAPDE